MKQNKVPKNEYSGKEPPQFRGNPYKGDVLYTEEGQWKYPGQVTKVPSSDITMRGVPYPVLGVDDLGNEQMMFPGAEYHFPGQYVTEYPQLMYGGDPSLPAINHQFKVGGTPSSLQHFKAKRGKTSKNIQSSINKIFLRNHTLFGHSGKNIYDPTAKYETGGWLDEYQTGGDFLKPAQMAAETSGVYKHKIPSLDTLRAAEKKRAARPWNEWSAEEQEQYINNPPKNMTAAQAEDWNKRAEQWSSAKAKKETTDEYVREGVRKTLVDNPVWNTAVSFTPVGAMYSLAKGATKVVPDVYKTIKNPTSVANYADIADDVLSMAHIPEAGVGIKSLAALKKVKVLGPEVGDIKKLYSTEKKFQSKEEEKQMRYGGWLDNLR